MSSVKIAAAAASTSFSSYGKSFQEKIFQGMATDKEWAQQMHEVMAPDYFDLKYLQFLTTHYFNYYDKYRCFPTMQLLIQIIRDELAHDKADQLLKDQIVAFLQRMRMNQHPEDLPYVKEKALQFCKRQAFKEALTQAVELVQGEQFESVVDLMRTAVSVGMPQSIGHEFFEDVEARFQEIQRITSPTGIPQLDCKEVLDGGLGRGELGVVVAPTGVGKSHWLVNMGAEALKRGKTVVHYTFELSETLTGKRYDANITDIPVSDLIDRKDEVLKHYEDNDYGNLIIKYYPCRSASVNTIRNHLEKLKLRNYTPSVVVIDYADVMKSTKSYDALRLELQLIYEELRQMAADFNVPVWTASQSNRNGANADMVGLENMGESYGKAQVSDVVLGLSRKPEEKASGYARLFVAKNRAGMDGLNMVIKIDTAKSTFKVASSEEQETYDLITNPKQKMKELWNQVQTAKKDLTDE
jgi:replicative DNA helicase